MTDVLFPLMSGADGATGVIVTWFVESGDEVTPTTLIAEVAVDKSTQRCIPQYPGSSRCSWKRARRLGRVR